MCSRPAVVPIRRSLLFALFCWHCPTFGAFIASESRIVPAGHLACCAMHRSRMRSLDRISPASKLAALERGAAAPRAGVRPARGRHLGGARRPAAAVVFLQRLSQSEPASGRSIAAAIAATERYGVGAGASRLVTGNHPLYAELEGRLARMKGTEAACVFGSGYLANTGIIPALVGRDDLISSTNCRMPASMPAPSSQRRGVHLTATTTSAMPRRCWPRIAAGTNRALIATDGVFSMDGDLAPLGELVALARRASTPGCCRTMRTALA